MPANHDRTADDTDTTNPIRPWTDRERTSMERSIDEIGVASPIIKSPTGEIVEGHHREALYRGRGLDAPVFVAEHLTTPALVAKARVLLNTSGRSLTWEERAGYVADLLRANPDQSDRQVANAAGASPTSVGKVRRALEAKGDVSTVDTRTDSRGRQQPASKPKAGSTRLFNAISDAVRREIDEQRLARGRTTGAKRADAIGDVIARLAFTARLIQDDDLTDVDIVEHASGPTFAETARFLADWLEDVATTLEADAAELFEAPVRFVAPGMKSCEVTS